MVATATASLLASVTPPVLAANLERDPASGLEYLEVVTGGAMTAAPLPLVIALHGLGDRPESFRLLLDDLPAKARVIVPRAPMPHGKDGFSWFEFRANDMDASGETGEGIRSSTERLSRLIASLTNKYKGPSRVVVCGFSQGGMLSFALAAAHPELLGAAVPISGYLPSSLWPSQRPTVRPLPTILALHGEADPLIPVESDRWSVEALRSNGYNAELRTWPGVAHGLSLQMRAVLTASVLKAVAELAETASAPTGPPPSESSNPSSVPVAPIAPPPAAPLPAAPPSN